ncbi:MAG TPA: hypothetical protein VNL71_22360 [Chloroflexota bacterium]|nr:hypothetical protein [Chloroflexota bacterium]
MKTIRRFLVVVSFIGLTLCADGVVTASQHGQATFIYPGPLSTSTVVVQG